MTPGARVQAAIEVLDAILQGEASEKALTNWARRSRFAGSKDRAAVRDHVYQALRCRRSYAAMGGSLTGRGLMIGAMHAVGAELDQIFDDGKFSPPALAPEELSMKDPTAEDLMDLPDWLAQRFKADLGDDAFEQAGMLRQRAPVVLRANLRKSDRTQVISELSEEGIAARPSEISPTAIVVTSDARKVSQTEGYTSGRFEIQDGASQAATDLLHIQPGSKVLDYCAGGGGKTLALAARADAQWFAHDALPARMRDLPSRAARAGVEIQLLRTDSLSRHAPYDLVLCDVPCSGSGTWRRTPDAKWKLTEAALTDLVVTQQDILRMASTLVSPKGALAYSTCSLLSQENTKQIDLFTAEQPDWTCEWTQSWKVGAENDGFFLALLKRK